MDMDFERLHSNETMRVLGKQISFWDFTPSGVGGKDFKNVMAAHNLKYANVMIYLDFVMLGVIYGQKMERARRNHKEIQPIDKVEIRNADALLQTYLPALCEMDEEQLTEIIEGLENIIAKREPAVV